MGCGETRQENGLNALGEGIVGSREWAVRRNSELMPVSANVGLVETGEKPWQSAVGRAQKNGRPAHAHTQEP